MTGVSDDSVHKKKPVTSIIIAALHQTLDERHTMRRVLKAIGTLGHGDTVSEECGSENHK